MTRYEIIADQSNIRIDKYIKIDSLTRAALQNLINEGNVTVNGEKVKSSFKLKLNDKIEVMVPEPKTPDIKAENIPLDIVYEDDCMLVINKPQGMVVHPAPGNYDGTLVNALMYHCKGSLSGINGIMRPGIVHRIDKDTSGLLLVAKNNEAHLSLSEQIKDKTVHMHYICIVSGILKTKKYGRAEKLIHLIKGMNCHVNLIPVNPIKERDFKQTEGPQISSFKNLLEKNGIACTIRREMGSDIDGACGQLRKSHLDEDNAE